MIYNSLKSLQLKDTYWSGEDDLLRDFYLPCLSSSVRYDRAVGFFSSSILQYISQGLSRFIENNGKMRLICGAPLSEQDLEAIERGYSLKKIIGSAVDREVKELLKDADKPNVKNLCWLIKNDKLDIKLCLRKSGKIFHEKFGIFCDSTGNCVSFMGSINESAHGWLFNEESFEVSYTWNETLEHRVRQKIERFNSLWDGTATSVKTFDFPDEAKEVLSRVAPAAPVKDSVVLETKGTYRFGDRGEVLLRDCQKEAIRKFHNSDSVCLFQMATGAGKTIAALYAMRECHRWNVLLILVPFIDLVTQWHREVSRIFPDDLVIRCGSAFPSWKSVLWDLAEAGFCERTIIISTYDSAISDFAMDKWLRVPEEAFALICDEVHNLGSRLRRRIMQVTPRYRIGVSATPIRPFDEEGTEAILDYFNHNQYTFSIRDAIDAGYLVQYEYKVYPCFLTDEEWEEYLVLTTEIKSLYARNFNSDDETERLLDKKLTAKLNQRAQIIKRAHAKLQIFRKIVRNIPAERRVLVYGDSKAQLKEYAAILDELGKDYFSYTGDVDSRVVRPDMLEEFTLGIRRFVLAIKCLDEGIDIPNCDTAIFISSSRSEREFIQRRGRVLRKSPRKNRAYIYDFLVVPDFLSFDSEERKIAREMVIREYERIKAFAGDAVNGSQVLVELHDFLDSVRLNPLRF